MTEYTITKNDAGQRADRFAARVEKHLAAHQIQTLFRKKEIKINGRPIKPDTRLTEGDILRIYLPAAWLRRAEEARAAPVAPHPLPEIVYEDEHMLILWKPAGWLSQTAEGQSGHCLESALRYYLYQTKAWSPETENAFVPSLCHRLDRGTEGLVMAAKTAEALRILTEKIKNHEIQKTYHCVVHGKPFPAAARLEDSLWKDAAKGRVFVRSAHTPGAKTAILEYRTLKTTGALSLLEVQLHTGRTHQIRVQLSSRGWPLLGDGKYGSLEKDKPYKPAHQALAAVALVFRFTSPAGVLDGLNGRRFCRPAGFLQEASPLLSPLSL